MKHHAKPCILSHIKSIMDYQRQSSVILPTYGSDHLRSIVVLCMGYG